MLYARLYGLRFYKAADLPVVPSASNKFPELLLAHLYGLQCHNTTHVPYYSMLPF